MIEGTIHSYLFEGLGDVFAFRLSEAIDDPRLSWVSKINELFDFLYCLFLLLSLAHIIDQVRAIEGRLQVIASLNPQHIDDVLLDFFWGGSGERNNRHFGELFSHIGQLEIVWSEIPAPFRYTVSLVDYKSGKKILGVEFSEYLFEVLIFFNFFYI